MEADGPPPRYAPVDEDHYPVAGNTYALSKVVSETVAGQIATWSGIPFVALRFSNIMPTYNALREAYGLAPASSFTDITGEATDRFPSAHVNNRDPIDDPDILDFIRLRDEDGNRIKLGSDAAAEEAVLGVRRSTLAARLKAIYGSVDKLDAFVGMISEPHVTGSELGPLQLAIWKRQFEALRDGDRFFYENDPFLAKIEQTYGITYKHTLAELIRLNTGATVAPNVFIAVAEDAAPAPG